MKRINITIPYTPRPLWRDFIHPAIESHRFNVIVAHRRFGKTVATINHVIKMAIQNNLPSPQYAYVAPLRTQAKLIAWSYLKFYTSVIPGIRVNESELYVELPTKHRSRAGPRIYIRGADNPDSLRGLYLDGVVLDEYAQMKPEVFDEIIRPALSDRTGWAIFIGTPKGQNRFYELFLKAQKLQEDSNSGWYTCMYTVDDSQIIPKEELEAMMVEMTENSIRQELYCDFTASAENVLVSIDDINMAMKRTVAPRDIQYSPLVLGVDIARFGDDATTIAIRKGLVAYKPLRYKGLDNMQIANIVAGLIQEHKPRAVFIDAGRGEGVIDRLRQMGYRHIIEVPFGSQASKSERFVNKRAEMWYEMAQWIKQGGSLPDDGSLRADLATPTYSFDTRGRIVLESKDKIKERLGHSPDKGDALALTFAYTVPQEDMYTQVVPPMANTKYNPFG